MNSNEEIMQNKTDFDKKRLLKRKVSKNLLTSARYACLVLLSFFFLFPFIIMVLRTFMTDAEVLALPVKIFPTRINFDSYVKSLDPSFLIYTKNTLIVIVFNVIAVPLASALCAFGFSKIAFKGREVMFSIVIATLMLPAIVVQIPLYVIYYKLHWINTLLPLTIPSMFGGGAINIFLIRQFMRGVPKDLENAAKIDGANVFQVFAKILLPLCSPVIIYVGIATFLGNWNDFMGPLLYLYNEEHYTLAIGIYNKFMGSGNGEYLANLEMATGMLLLIPPLILFIFFQKQLIQGVATTGLKG
jgi:multiple sugar transport system permease protein